MSSTSVSSLRSETESHGAAKNVRTCMFTAESQKGHARYTRDLLSAIAAEGVDRGVEVELVTGADLSPNFQSSHYPINRILPPLANRNAFKSKVAWGISRVSHYIRRENTFLRFVKSRPDLRLVHIQEYTPWLATRHFAKLRRGGVEVVMTVHNIANYGHANQRYVRAMQGNWRTAWRTCSALIVHTEGLRDELGRFLGPGHPPIHVTPHAVWEERSTPPITPAAPNGDETARLLFFGMVRANKGLHVLLRAMEFLPNCTLTIAGEHEPGTYHDAILKLVAQRPAGQIELINEFIDQQKISGYFDRSHLVILPYTDFASQSGVLHQALAHGRPVVASNVGGLGESVRHWGIGEVVEPKNERALASGVVAALCPEKYRKAAQAAENVRSELTWAKMANATCDVYHSLVH